MVNIGSLRSSLKKSDGATSIVSLQLTTMPGGCSLRGNLGRRQKDADPDPWRNFARRCGKRNWVVGGYLGI